MNRLLTDHSFRLLTDYSLRMRRSFQDGEECRIASVHSEITFPPRDLNTLRQGWGPF